MGTRGDSRSDVGWAARGEAKDAGGRSLVRGPHSTDNVTFFNPRFTLFVLASAVRKAPKQLTSTSVHREQRSLVTVPWSSASFHRGNFNPVRG